MVTLAPFHLQPKFVERTWGRASLAPWYAGSLSEARTGSSEPIGEAWLTGPECIAADGEHQGETLSTIAHTDPAALLGAENNSKEFPLLIKLLFPDAKLSVQVHPNDAQAGELGMERGKTECWYILQAEPDATVACGLRPGTSLDQLRHAIADGTAESLLQHLPVRKGDMVFVDAGTVHAIGPGVTILEIQQTSDTTYRLYDYGRPRELHVDQGLAVTQVNTRAGKQTPQPIPHGTRLIQEQYFTVDSFLLEAGDTLILDDAHGKPHTLTALYGDAEIAVASQTRTELPASGSAIVPASTGPVIIRAISTLELVRATP